MESQEVSIMTQIVNQYFLILISMREKYNPSRTTKNKHEKVPKTLTKQP